MSRLSHRVALVLGLAVVTSTAASAQTMGVSPSSGGTSNARGRMAEAARLRMLGKTIRVHPNAVIVDTTMRAATLIFTNESGDTLTAAIAAGVTPPPTILDSAGAPSIDAVDAPDSTFLTKEKPLAADHSLAAWMTDLPKTITIPPHESKTVVVHLVPPKGAVSGEYAAWVIATTDFSALAKAHAPQTRQLGHGVVMSTVYMGPQWNAKQLDTISKQLQSGTKVSYRLP